MNDLTTVRPLPGVCVPAPVGPGDAAATGMDRPTVRVARDVMTLDPDRVAGSDSLIEVAYTMRSLLVAFLPVCDRDGDLQGIIALGDLPRVFRGADSAGVTASTLAEPAVTIGVEDPVDHVSELMAGQRIWLLPVAGRPPLGRSHPLRNWCRPCDPSGPRSLPHPGACCTGPRAPDPALAPRVFMGAGHQPAGPRVDRRVEAHQAHRERREVTGFDARWVSPDGWPFPASTYCPCCPHVRSLHRAGRGRRDATGARWPWHAVDVGG